MEERGVAVGVGSGTMVGMMRAMWVVALACVGLVVAGCSARTPLQPEPPIEVSGQATYRERMLLPPGSTFEVRVVDMRSEPPRRVGFQSFKGQQSPPFVFSLLVPEQDAREQADLLLIAEVRGPDGVVLFRSKGLPISAGEWPPSRDLDVLMYSER